MEQKRLICDECGCASDGKAKGWAAFLGDDPGAFQPTCACIFCPACAFQHFGYRQSAPADTFT